MGSREEVGSGSDSPQCLWNACYLRKGLGDLVRLKVRSSGGPGTGSCSDAGDWVCMSPQLNVLGSRAWDWVRADPGLRAISPCPWDSPLPGSSQRGSPALHREKQMSPGLTINQWRMSRLPGRRTGSPLCFQGPVYIWGVESVFW